MIETEMDNLSLGEHLLAAAGGETLPVVFKYGELTAKLSLHIKAIERVRGEILVVLEL